MSVRYSVVIPTLDEAARITRVLTAARDALPGAEVIVADGGSADHTRALASAAGALVLEGPRGRGLQLARGAAAARGDVVIFLHADTLLPPDAGAAIDAALQDEGCVGGAFSLSFDEERVPFLLRQLARLITLRSGLFRTATGDQAIFARRSLLARIELPSDPLFEDVRLFRVLKRSGRVVILRARVRTSLRLWQRVGPLRLISIHLAFRLLHSLGVPTWRLARWYPASASR